MWEYKFAKEIELTQEVIDYVFCRTKSFKDPVKVKEMCEMRVNGATLKAIADKYGYASGETVRQKIYKVKRLYNSYRLMEQRRAENG